MSEPVLNSSLTKDERTFAMVCHVSSLVGLVVPLGNIIAPLVIWLIKKDTMPFVDDQGKESLNFQISVTIYLLLCIPLVFVVIGIPLLFVIAIADVILTIIATIKANDGFAYRYPLTIRFIR
ncbi:MAG TPA: DUF4870 domain-containing protein [Thermoanaerobaculia bacterium]|nr:DUF4870 domain-containing protein [Thermoanaerobaculia bacterium]